MTEFFAPASGFALLLVSALLTYLIGNLKALILILPLLASVACLAAIRFGLYAETAPLLIIYINGALMGGLTGYLILQRGKA